VVFCGFLVVPCRVFVMFCCFAMMLCCFLRHKFLSSRDRYLLFCFRKNRRPPNVTFITFAYAFCFRDSIFPYRNTVMALARVCDIDCALAATRSVTASCRPSCPQTIVALLTAQTARA
jgi:hypothetical protein